MKFVFPLKNKGILSVFALGGTSRIDLLGADIDTTETAYYGRIDENAYPDFRSGVVGISFEKSLNKKTFAKLVVGASAAQQLYREDSIALTLPEKPTFLKTDATFNSTKYSLVANLTHKFSSRSSLYFGLSSDLNIAAIFRKTVNNETDRIWVNFEENNLLTQGYATWKYRLGNKLTFNTGLHTQHISINNQLVAEPRLGINFQATEKSAFNFGYGLHHQAQGLYTYYVQNQSGEKTNLDLDFSRSNQFVLGYQYQFSENILIKLEAYYQYLSKIPVHSYSSSFSMINEGTSQAPVDQVNLANNGTGNNYGIDITVERYLENGFYYLITSSLFDSRYKGSDGIERNTAFNTEYVLNTLVGKQWKLKKAGNTLALNIRFTTTGGRYFTPLNLDASQDAGIAIEDNTKAFSEKQDPYLRLDFKVAYRKEFKKSSLEVALDLQNVTDNKNIFRQGYNRTNNVISNEYQQSTGIFPRTYHSLYILENSIMILKGNKVIITGATAGIGRALTEKFLEFDNQIIAVARNKEKLDKFAKLDKRIVPFQCDITKQTELDRLVLFVEQEHQDTNILVNNAGIQYNYDFAEEMQLLAKIEHEIATNLLAPIKLIALLLPVLKANDNSAIVNVSSGLGLVPKKQAPVYCGTKAAIHIFSKSLRYQLERVKVFEIIPPLVDTEMTKGRGKDKICPNQLADEFINAFRNNKYEVSIGKVKLLKIINRISPFFAERLMKGG